MEEANDEVETGKDGDEELDLWEQEQIKKGASIPAAQKEQTLGPALPPVEQPMPMEGTFQSIGPFASAYYPYGQGIDVVLFTQCTFGPLGLYTL